MTIRPKLKQIAYVLEAIDIDGAIKGNIQQYNKNEENLSIIAHHGFDRKFLEHF